MIKVNLSAALLAAAVLVGCVQVPIEEPGKETQLAISSVKDLPIEYAKGSTFRISSRYLESASVSREQLASVYKLYEKNISQLLQSAGYQMSLNDSADFEVVYAVALEKDLSDQTINERFGVSPGLQVSDDLEKGSFLIYIEDSESKQRVWRGAVQGFVQEDFSASERVKRTEHVVRTVMSSFFNAN
ncbi:DUF4136 domain-containing protein [Thalassotalea euphylliae]|uniref:DUF4136 domain-containing protein n=1 Tax=Thalassotalea euphylliae TaxID=1655234 RepID=UPI0036431961